MGMTSQHWHRRQSALRNYVMWAGVCAYVAAVVYAATVAGPNLQRASETQIAEEIEHENRAACGRFGMGPETGAQYQRCAAELRAVRQSHENRLETRNRGPFL